MRATNIDFDLRAGRQILRDQQLPEQALCGGVIASGKRKSRENLKRRRTGLHRPANERTKFGNALPAVHEYRIVVFHIRPERGGAPQKLLLRHLVKAIWLDIAQLALFGDGQIVFGDAILRVDSQNVQPIARAAAVRRAGTTERDCPHVQKRAIVRVFLQSQDRAKFAHSSYIPVSYSA